MPDLAPPHTRVYDCRRVTCHLQAQLDAMGKRLKADVDSARATAMSELEMRAGQVRPMTADTQSV